MNPALVLVSLLVPLGAPAGAGPSSAFSTGGHTVYHLRPATIAPGKRAVICAAYDGAVLCFSPDGEKLWQAPTGGAFPFDLAVCDIDGDGLDETLVASSDGNLYALDDNGSRLWALERTPPLFQVCVARLAGGKRVVLAGGVEQVLHVLSPQGKVLGSMKIPHCIRHVRAGDILGDGRDRVAVATTTGGLSGRLSLLLVDPADRTVLWRRTNLGTHAHNSGKRFFSMLLVDLDKDGRRDILLSDSWGEHGRIFAFDQQGRQVFTTTDPRIPNIPYRMNLLRHVVLPGDEYIAGHFGNVLIQYNLDGSCRKVLRCPYSFADGAFDPATRTWYTGSSVAGGDAIHALRLDRPDWQQAFERLRPAGRLARIERNIQRLRDRIAGFEPPAYQPPPRDATVLGRKPRGRAYRHLAFLSGLTLSQKYENRSELWCRSIDARRRYDKTAGEIVAAVKKREAAGGGFVIWSGHGHAAYFPLSTFERILEAAPQHLWGFEFAEMEGVDAQMQEVVKKILLPVAEMCRKRGKHVIFRNKNIFWNGTCYVPFWRDVLFDGKYREVFVPALEETNSRTQELSLSGRVGLWLAGRFRRWSCRMVTDNANFDRMWEWGGQQVPVHHLRHLVSRASLGADVFFNSVHQGPFTTHVTEQLTPFYDMLEKGIVRIPEREELLSVSGAALGMRSPPDPGFIQHGTNGHRYRYPQDDHSAMVFDRLDCYWAGALLEAHDFSRYAMGIDRRMCNYLPVNPYGLVCIVPERRIPGDRLERTFISDGRYFYEGGARRGAAEFRATVEAKLREAAARLPVLVAGGVHWSAVRLDATHVRVTLVDPGYLDPSDREAGIVLQHMEGVAARDILSRDPLPVRSGRIDVRVPAGMFRIVDIERR